MFGLGNESGMTWILRLVEEGCDQLFGVFRAWLTVAVGHRVDDAAVFDPGGDWAGMTAFDC